LGLLLDLAVVFDGCNESGMANYDMYRPHFDWHAHPTRKSAVSASMESLPWLHIPTRADDEKGNATLLLHSLLNSSARGFRMVAGPDSLPVNKLLRHPANAALARQKIGPHLTELSDAMHVDGCLLRYLLMPSLPLSEELHRLTAHVRISPSGLLGMVTMHVRLGDSVFDAAKDWMWKDERKSPEFRANPGGAFACLRNAAHLSPQWGCLDCAVISDSIWTGQCARAILKRPLVTEGEAVHYLASDSTAATSEMRSSAPKVLVDWWLLAQSERAMLSAQWSSFSIMALAYRHGWDAGTKNADKGQSSNKDESVRVTGSFQVVWKGQACAKGGLNGERRTAASRPVRMERASGLTDRLQQQIIDLSDRDYRAHVDAQCEMLYSVTRLAEDGLWLTRRYRRLWAGTRMLPGRPAFFISLPWQQLFEHGFRRAIFPDKQTRGWNGSRASHPQLALLRQLMTLWRSGLDWRRQHIVILNQISLQQMNFYARLVDPTFSWTRETLVIFDTRLWNLAMGMSKCLNPPEPWAG